MPGSLNRKLCIGFAATVALAAATWLVHGHLAITVTPSLRYTVFFLLSGPETGIRRGDYVVFELAHPMTRKLKFSKAIKEVVCAEGDRLVVNGKDYYCNGTHLGRAKDASLEGAAVEHFRYDGIVPAGSLFVMGHGKDSFDSRYFGFIGVGDVETIAHPLF